MISTGGLVISAAPSAPQNTVLPSISGTAQAGATLTADPGTWTGAPTFSYVWFADDVEIDGETDDTLLLTDAEVGAVITVEVTATEDVLTGSATSLPTEAVLIHAPVNTVAPAITGTPTVGQTVSVSNGTWSYAPTGYTRQWRRNGTPISGAVAADYTLEAADQGTNITAVVTAENAGGSTPHTSNQVGPVAAAGGAVPANTVAPVISGDSDTTGNLTTTNGTWTGSPAFTYQWFGDGNPISGATANTLAKSGAHASMVITCRVTGTNVNGAGTEFSNEIGPLIEFLNFDLTATDREAMVVPSVALVPSGNIVTLQTGVLAGVHLQVSL